VLAGLPEAAAAIAVIQGQNVNVQNTATLLGQVSAGCAHCGAAELHLQRPTARVAQRARGAGGTCNRARLEQGAMAWRASPTLLLLLLTQLLAMLGSSAAQKEFADCGSTALMPLKLELDPDPAEVRAHSPSAAIAAAGCAVLGLRVLP
jgi:hypothetical protein